MTETNNQNEALGEVVGDSDGDLTKADVIKMLSGLQDTDKVVIGITRPKSADDEGFTMGDESDDGEEENSNTRDNEDGTVTDFYPISDVIAVLDAEDGNNQPMRYGVIELDMTDGDEDDEEEGETESE